MNSTFAADPAARFAYGLRASCPAFVKTGQLPLTAASTGLATTSSTCSTESFAVVAVVGEQDVETSKRRGKCLVNTSQRRGGQVDLNLHDSEPEVVLSVANTGATMTADEAAKIADGGLTAEVRMPHQPGT